MIILANIALLLVYPVRYFPFWLIGSFVVYSAYFLIMFLPLTSKKKRPAREIVEKSGVNQTTQMLKKDKKIFGHIFWNLFFVTSETMFFGVLMLFGIDIVFVMYTSLFVDQTLWDVGALIITQSVLIIAFYSIISWEQPYSRYFSKDIMGMKDKVKDQVTQRTESKIAASVAVAGFFLALLGFALFIFMWALMKPGGTLGALLQEITMQNLWVLAIIIASQLFVFRFFQGLYSERNVRNILEVRKRWLTEELVPSVEEKMKVSREVFEQDAENMMFDARRHRSQVAISQVYTVAYMDMFGFLPIFLIGTDYGPLLDDDVNVLLRDNLILME